MTQLPCKNALARDYWGYSNGYNSNSNMYANPYRFDYNLTGDLSAYSSQANNNTSSNETYLKSSILQKITYPTGGYTEFEFELNSFTNYKVPSYSFTNTSIFPNNHVSQGAGLRIKRIKNFSDNGVLDSRKVYFYEGGKLMSPINLYNKSYLDPVYYPNQWAPNTINYAKG